MIADLESLRCFDAAAHAPSFRAAAQRVHLSPAAFGERIRRLEELLEQPLFTRTTRRVVLTEAGLRLQPLCRRILEDTADLKSKVAATTAPVPHVLTLGTRYELGLSWLVPSLTPLSEQRPERQLNLVFGDTPELLRQLKTGACDAIVTSARMVAPGLQQVALHPEQYVFVGAPGLLERRPLSRPEHAARHVLLDAHPDLPLFRYFLDGAPADEVWSFARTELLGTTAAIRARVLEGAGVAVLPSYFVAPDLRARRLRRLIPKTQPSQDHFRLLYPQDHPRGPAIRTLAEDLRARPLR